MDEQVVRRLALLIMNNHLIYLNHWSSDDFDKFYLKVIEKKSNFLLKKNDNPKGFKGQLAYLFFEPSTRTRMSFERAAYLSGVSSILLSGVAGTSLEKGESIEDTILNIQAMQPQALVIRCSDEVDLINLANQSEVPIICAGWGKKAHPTQALLDLVTIKEALGEIKNKNILFIGDLASSRVVSSHFELLPRMGVNIGCLGPKEFSVARPPAFKINLFEDKNQALGWADLVIALRVQKERHSGRQNELNLNEYINQYQVMVNDYLKHQERGLKIMHPGPINWGVELSTQLQPYVHSFILNQVTNGVFTRSVILDQFGGWQS